MLQPRKARGIRVDRIACAWWTSDQSLYRASRDATAVAVHGAKRSMSRFGCRILDVSAETSLASAPVLRVAPCMHDGHASSLSRTVRNYSFFFISAITSCAKRPGLPSA